MSSITQLSCCADTCGHNKNGYCCLNSIEVGGNEAKSSYGTFCSNFVEKSGQFTNDTQLQCPYSSVQCSADTCAYNASGHCEADYINIAGHLANIADETLCSTFIPK